MTLLRVRRSERFALSQLAATLIIAISNISVAQAAAPITYQAGFSVQGNKIIDNSTGNQFIPVGYNVGFSWYPATPLTDLSNLIPQTGANAVRLYATSSWANGISDTTALKADLVQSSLQGGLVPIITEGAGQGSEVYSPTDGSWGLKQSVDEWTSPSNVALFKANPDLILNISNEWGPANSQVWADGYKTAVAAIRTAGINNLLVIDSGMYGQDPYNILNYAQSVEDSDPIHKSAFSIHMYYDWVGAGGTDTSLQYSHNYNIEEYLAKFAALNVPVMIGEFGNSASNYGFNNYNPGILAQEANQLGIGWQYWIWSSSSVVGNDPNVPTVNDLSTNSAYGLQKLSTQPSYGLNSTFGVPEPLNILGGMTVLGIGAAWKRKLSRKSK